MNGFQRRRLILAAAPLFVACGTDGITGTVDGDRLSDEEAGAVLYIVAEATSNAFARVELSEGTTEGRISMNVHCLGGGSIRLYGNASGTMNAAGTGGTIDMDVLLSITNCVVLHESGRITINGSPYLQFSGSVAFVTNGSSIALNGSFTLQGGLSYHLPDARAGTCSVDVRFGHTRTRASLNGMFCGHRINESVSL